MENKGINIVVIDTDEEVIELLTTTLEGEGYSVLAFRNSEEALKKIVTDVPHLILIELNMQGLDGIEICMELRSNPLFDSMRIVFYSSVSEDNSQVAAFNAGADGYMIKPIKPRVLISRVRAYLRRYMEGNLNERKTKYLGLRIDRERYLIYKDETEIVLPRKEFELLSLLSSMPQKVFTRKEISKLIWDTEIITNRTIDVHIRKLREKLGQGYIKTFKGVGYSLEI